MHHIPILLETREPASANSPNGHSSGYGSTEGLARPEPHNNVSRSASSASQASASSSNRSGSPATATQTYGESPVGSPLINNNNLKEIPITIGGMPKVRSTGMGQSTSAKPKPHEAPIQKSSSGPYVTRIPVNAQHGDGNADYEYQVPEAKPSPLKIIEDIYNEVESFHKEVNEFAGEYQDKQYRFLDEMLTRCMIKLDNVETGGDEQIRQARKRAINAVHQSVSLLENRGNRPGAMKTPDKSCQQDQQSFTNSAASETLECSTLEPISDQQNALQQKSSSSGHVPHEGTPV